MLISKNIIVVGAVSSLLFLGSSTAVCKGLDNLQPSTPDASAADTAGAEEAKAGAKEAAEGAKPEVVAKKEASKTSKALADKLYFATSYGWVSASASEGEWKSSGMSDVTVGYLLMPSFAGAKLFGTYRYAPIAVSGEVDGYSYRGVWEAHNFGGKAFFGLSSDLYVSALVELGYVAVSLNSLDNREEKDSHAEGGALVNLGTSLEWQLSPKLTLGPKLVAGFGGFTVIQLGAGARFLF